MTRGKLVTALDIARRFAGRKEVPGQMNDPQIMAMLLLDEKWPTSDEVPWCSAFVNYVAWILALQRSDKLLARSWLKVGQRIPFNLAEPGFDVVVLKRGKSPQPGSNNFTAQGHVGFYVATYDDDDEVEILGGNQNDSVSLARFPVSSVLAVQRLHA